jgi:hypothetical protein
LDASPTCKVQHGSGKKREYGRRKELEFGSLRREDSSYSYKVLYGWYLYYYGYRVLSSADADTDADAGRVTTAQLMLRFSLPHDSTDYAGPVSPLLTLVVLPEASFSFSTNVRWLS